MSTWIKLHRRIIYSDVFDNDKLLRIWIWCLVKASYKDHDQVVGRQVVPLKPGQFIYGRKKAAVELGYSESTVRDYMAMLEKMGSITITPTNKFSIITVCQWGLYQSEEEKSDNKKTADKPTEGQQKDTNKNIKKGKKVKKDLYGEFVRLEKVEYEKLVDRLGEPLTLDYIDRLNNYIGSSGKRYKSHYHTILTWVRKDEAKKPPEPKRKLDIYIPEGD